MTIQNCDFRIIDITIETGQLSLAIGIEVKETIDIEGYFKTIKSSIKSQKSLTNVNTIDIEVKHVIDIETSQLS